MARQYVTDLAVEALNDAVRLQAAEWADPMLDTSLVAEHAKEALAAGGVLRGQSLGVNLVTDSGWFDSCITEPGR